MTLKAKIEIINEEYRSLKSRLDQANADLTNRKTRVDAHRELVKDLTERQQFLDEVRTLLNNAVGTHPAATFDRVNWLLDYPIDSTQSHLDDAKFSLEADTTALADYARTAAQLRESLDGMAGGEMLPLTKRQLQRELQGVTNLDPKTVCIGESDNGPFLRWTYRGIVMTPRHNSYPGINRGAPPAIPLRDVVVVVNLNRNQLTMAPAYDQIDAAVRLYANHPTVHPHIMSGHTPCLGDFGGPIGEAIANRDWNTLATVCGMFLETADPADPAGATWYKFIAGNRIASSLRDYGEREKFGFPIRKGDDTFWAFFDQNEDGTWTESLSYHPFEFQPVDETPKAPTHPDHVPLREPTIVLRPQRTEYDLAV